MKPKECLFKEEKRQKMGMLVPPERKGSFKEVELEFSKEVARTEAKRCLGSYPCSYCEVCILLCPDLCITRNELSGEIEIDLDYCKGCGICALICPKGAIEMIFEEK